MVVLAVAMALFCCIGAGMGISNSHRRFEQARKHLEATLLDKGMTLIANNSVALRGAVEDNAFLAIREIVATTVARSSDVVYGIFMDDNLQPWAMVTPENPVGTVQGQRELHDSVSIWAHSVKIPSYRFEKSKGSPFDIIEIAAPVINADGLRLGVIRYGISTGNMRKAIAEERKQSLVSGIVSVILYVIVVGFVFVAGVLAARKWANGITKPIEHLASSVNAITAGNYSQTVAVESDDEIGLLAANFEAMRLKIKEYTENLESMVAHRTQQLEAAHKEIVEKAHRAGMADIAIGTLHNVGNILNSVKASADNIEDIQCKSPMFDFVKASRLLRENSEDVESFIRNDPRGKKLMQYFLKLEEPFLESYKLIDQNLRRLSDKIAAINDVISAQQNYAGVGGLSEKVNIKDVIEDALLMQSDSNGNPGFTINRDFGSISEVYAQKNKLMHVIVNVIKNAKESMSEIPFDKKTITFSTTVKDSFLYIKISDTGSGIKKENITKIFSHGFTTKKNGHGFGLHSSANYMKEMGGEMWAESDGAGCGAHMIVKIPVQNS